jgi:hypothetical protein
MMGKTTSREEWRYAGWWALANTLGWSAAVAFAHVSGIEDPYGAIVPAALMIYFGDRLGERA